MTRLSRVVDERQWVKDPVAEILRAEIRENQKTPRDSGQRAKLASARRSIRDGDLDKDESRSNELAPVQAVERIQKGSQEPSNRHSHRPCRAKLEKRGIVNLRSFRCPTKLRNWAPGQQCPREGL